MTVNHPDTIYRIALSLCEGVGPILAKNLINTLGSAEAVFKESDKTLGSITGINIKVRSSIKNDYPLQRAEEEMTFVDRNGFLMHFFQDASYPRRLKHCADAPVIIYQKGNLNLNPGKAVSIVGTRSVTDYGRSFIDSFMPDLKGFQPQVISGLAYGVDAIAHREALNHQLKTIAVVAHGLDSVYPALHRGLAKDILEQGGAIVTEFLSKSKPDRENFPKRNRIIAGMSDAVIVVEAARKGGALITADLAFQYNRDVFAVPGRFRDTYSEGCNLLIKSNRANLLESTKDLEYIMRWQEQKQVQQAQLPLFDEMSTKEQNLITMLGTDSSPKEIEWLAKKMEMPMSQLLVQLMNLELKGVLISMPGKRYRLA
jgi:DNA processing protein